MGGMGGTCRGKTKLACYKNFRREVNRKEIATDSTRVFARVVSPDPDGIIAIVSNPIIVSTQR